MNQTQRRIDRYRRTGLRIIVLGRDGKPVSGATVKIQQVRHDFPLGFVVGEGGLPRKGWRRPVWRCFNAVSLAGISGWPTIQPKKNRWRLDRVERVVRRARRVGMRIRWGGMISADAAFYPDWAADLRGTPLQQAIEADLTAVLHRFGRRVAAFDLYTHALGHSLVERRLGTAMVRRMFEQAKATAPAADICLRLGDVLTPRRVAGMARRITSLRQAFVPFDAVAVDQRIGGVLLQRSLAGVFDQIDKLDIKLVLSSLEVDGASSASAAVNLETFLRTAFADPQVRGIYFSGLTADELADASGSLIDSTGDPTDAGRILDRLFHKLWWTHQTFESDELGNVRTRVFVGTHRITAELPGGARPHMTVYVPRRDPAAGPRLVVLQPVGRADKSRAN